MSPCGFVVVGDSIDKNVRPSFQKDNKSIKSFHHFHSFATKTRIGISTLSDEQPGTALLVYTLRIKLSLVICAE